ncbi:MAG: XshC-Cox1 family protein [SAR202 cluster bacterium]|nr:XshC-Cox1 family protein [SAR202 cluster bacterium]
MQSVYEEAAALAEQGSPFVIATVVHTKGSTPQKPGASLLVRSDGSTVGTLGGGCVEGDIWFAASQALRDASGPLFKDYFLNEDIAAREGLVCGGSMFFFIEPFPLPLPAAGLLRAIAHAYHGGIPLASAIVVRSSRLPLGSRLVLRSDGARSGSLGDPFLDDQAASLADDLLPLGKTALLHADAGDDVFIAAFTSPPSLLLVGGGHVNLAVSRFAHLLGFRVLVTDDRREFASKDRFPMAELVAVHPYDAWASSFPITPNTAIVVSTRGHREDDLALEAALRTPASYVGLIGSKRKTLLIHEALLRRGIPLQRLKDVRAPIGLDLGGRSPEEIALSILAEIVAFRHGRHGAPLRLDHALLDRLAQQHPASA